nr:DUF859 family phage minor structural protein [uncultured Caproiciproducens sp.]
MSGGDFSFNANIGNFDINSSFNFEIAASDYYTVTAQSALLPTAKPVFSIRDGQIGINKIPEDGALDVSGDIYISGNKAYSDGYHPNADTVGGLHVLKGSASGTTATSTAYGSIYYSADINVSFGTTLPASPNVMVSFNTNGFGYCIVKSISTTGFTVKITNAVTSSGVNWGIQWIECIKYSGRMAFLLQQGRFYIFALSYGQTGSA